MTYVYSVKEYEFGAISNATIGSLGGGSKFSLAQTSHSINGEILQIAAVANFVTGSVFLTVSGTNELIWGTQLLSGAVATPIRVSPRLFPYDSTNVLISGVGGQVEKFAVNAPLILGGSGHGAGSIVSFQVRYR